MIRSTSTVLVCMCLACLLREVYSLCFTSFIFLDFEMTRIFPRLVGKKKRVLHEEHLSQNWKAVAQGGRVMWKAIEFEPYAKLG